ncbi:hypothetical protein Tco_0053173 [Tanacetum coccineum]
MYFCVIVIACTPAIHALDIYFRVMYYPDSFGVAFTFIDGGKEFFSALTAVCFMVLLEMQLEHRHGEKYLAIVEDKQFEIHYPFDLYPPFEYVASANKLFLMRFVCYFPIPLIVIMYGLRAMLEKKKEFSNHVWLHYSMHWLLNTVYSIRLDPIGKYLT